MEFSITLRFGLSSFRFDPDVSSAVVSFLSLTRKQLKFIQTK
jgi:hypothetical protein